jgi:ABC-type transporter Mla subunit MlaD
MKIALWVFAVIGVVLLAVFGFLVWWVWMFIRGWKNQYRVK